MVDVSVSHENDGDMLLEGCNVLVWLSLFWTLWEWTRECFRDVTHAGK